MTAMRFFYIIEIPIAIVQMATEPIFKFFTVIAIAHAITNIIAIRMHSNRMRTARLLMYPGEVSIGGLYLGGLLPGGQPMGSA